ncbi:protoporphyrinogen oxidase [Alicyclobacillus macrosporangiidus]|jgi:oxygen-dependent protoporphyrinogen oxidase|uniref:Coproporphyrinogen III oxidase n=1 Tax=Alicyclobacillus macrosporangiidus TaxID=392015 RepID=A0A1I7L2Y4_9BACL|nr:protoporphyrinogen oxidase [Alicyclobacillus macrosporangiidus]SFV04103.1 oxygen-dependent protoporphyrinogen oxidase [Alicyclobacillus macrosporangiidus]
MSDPAGQRTRVVIIGGGITGLAAALALKDRADGERMPIRVTLLEQASRVGGKVRTYREHGFVMEAGPDSLLARKPAGVGLIRRLGVEGEMVGTSPQATKTYIAFRGRLEPIPPGTNMGIPTRWTPFARTRLLSPAGKARALWDLVLPRGNRDEDESVGAFLRRRVGDEVVDHIAEPLLAGIYAGSIDRLSLLATAPQFRRLEEQYRSLILGSIRERRAAARAAASRAAAPEQRRPGENVRSVFVTLRSGLETLVERLYDTLYEWADIRTRTAAVSIQRTVDGYAVDITGPDGDERLTADAVIVATPAHAAARLVGPLCPVASRLENVRYVSTATVILGFRPDSVPARLDASGFVVPRQEGLGITACTWVSSKWPHAAGGKGILLRCYVGRDGQQEGLQQTDAEMVAMVRRELSRLIQLDASPWFTIVTRWKHAMPQYDVGHLSLVAQVDESVQRTLPGVALAGAAYRGVGVPDCIADGQRAAERVFEHLVARRREQPPTGQPGGQAGE